MKYVRQLLIILFVSFLGELLKSIIPLSIPASIYGMVLLFLALELKILKVSDIKETSNFLIEIMPLMFVPAGVGLLDSWGALQPIWIQVVVITLISTVIVMGVSGSITQFVIRKGKKKETREGISYSYRLLLSWLIEEPKLFVQIREWVKPEDFEEGLYRTVAKELYDQLDRGDLEPARIIGHFEEVEDQNKVASMFQTSFGSKIENDEKKKAITDLILKIKEHSIERQAGQITDLNELQKLVQQKKMLQGAVNLHIS